MTFDFDGASQALLLCQPQALRHLAQRDGAAISQYLRIVEEAAGLDLTAPEAASFRRLCNGQCGVRQGEAWHVDFYHLFEGLKVHPGTSEERFSFAITHLEQRTRRIEASFASKIVATLDPSAPVLDSIVSAFLTRHGLEARSAGTAGAINTTVKCGWF